MLARLTVSRLRQGSASFYSTDRLTLAAVATFFGLLFIALFGERSAPHEPLYFVVEHGTDPRPYDPGIVFPFGSDILGRDLFSLVLAGAQATLTIVLVGGVARVVAGIVVAVIGNLWPPLRLVTESLAEFVSAIPATIVALVIVKVFVRTDTSIAVFVGALLVIGWAGPYRVIRSELDRLSNAPFTQGARSIGATRWRVFWRHHVPHLVPVVAVNLSQQVVASLVLVAELGVLGTFVGTTRTINIEESLGRVVTGPVNVAMIADPPEWGGLLASARTIESLWTTRWLIVVPGVAFALTALAVAVLGLAIARRYARRELIDDVRGPGVVVVITAVVLAVIAATVLPERYAPAEGWAAKARAALRTGDDTATAFAEAGLKPVDSSFALTREVSSVERSGPVRVTIDGRSLDEATSRENNAPLNSRNVEALVTAETGGGTVDAPIVYVARGISPSEVPPPPQASVFAGALPPLGRLIKDYPDDYSEIDVRGKVVLVTRFLGISTVPPGSNRRANVEGFSGDEAAAGAIKRGAAAVIVIDPALRYYTDTVESVTYGLGGVSGGVNPYLRLERESPATTTGGVPVIVLSTTAAQPLVDRFGINLAQFARYDEPYEYANARSQARPIDGTARVEVPLQRRAARATTVVGEVAGAFNDSPRVLVWATRREETHPTSEVLAALARTLGSRGVPFVFVDFDDSLDRRGTIDELGSVLRQRPIGLVLVLERLDGDLLRFTTPYGDLIPAVDTYAARARAAHATTLSTATISELSEIAPFIDVKTIVIRGNGGDGDLRPDATALVAYVAGRVALGAEELPHR